MRKIIAGINMTLDGYCDHTAVNADEELHQHYTDILNDSGVILYGRITYQLMEFWPPFIENPTGNKQMDDFALAIDRIPKIVFSTTLKKLEWKTAKLANKNLKDVVLELKQEAGKDILVGSPSLIINLLKLNLVDELQLCVHPRVVGSGLPLFKDVQESIDLTLIKTKTLKSGAIILYYEKGAI